MPQAIPVVITAINSFGTVVLGTSISTSLAIGSAIQTAALVGLSLGANALLTPGLPKQTGQTPIKQSVSPRKSGFGDDRLSGPYALFEGVGEKSLDVIPFHDGQINAIIGYLLNDDLVTVDGSNYVISPDGKKYEGSDRCRFLIRMGLPTETAFSEVTAIYPTWSAAHRGDGISSLALICRQATDKHQQERWPNGVPLPSVIAELQLVYDPRDMAQIQGDKTTYLYSRNPILHAMAYLTDANGGMGLDYAKRVLPAEADWIAAADICDEAVSVTSGGTEPRYSQGGSYSHDNAPSDVLGEALRSCDGWLAPRGDGAFTVLAGQFRNPTVAIDDKHVVAENVRFFVPDEEACNELSVTYTNPATNYQEDQAGTPLQDAADVAARGRVRNQKFDLPWVRSPSQARRLAARRLSRETAELRGQTRTNLYGLNCLGERYIRRRSSENAALSNVVLEVLKVQLDLANLAVTIDWVLADACIDECANDITVFTPSSPRPTPTPLVAPTINALTAIYDAAVAGAAGARISIDVTSPLSGDLEWLYRTKPSASSLWVEGQASDIAPGASVTLETTFIQATGALDVQVAYRTAGSVSPWSATDTIVLAAPPANAPVLPTSQNVATTTPQVVAYWDDAGTAKVRLAWATNDTRQAEGIVRDAAASGTNATVFAPGAVIDGFGGALTTGAVYFLDPASAGDITATQPTTPGQWLQEVGYAADPDHLVFLPKNGTLL